MNMHDTGKHTIAYFSMEIGIHADVPTYSGGLGMLAGDTIRSAADLHVPLVAVSLLHRKGYFFQKLSADGWQIEEPVHWSIDDYLVETAARTEVTIEGRPVHLRAWRFDVTGADGFVVPIFLLDADLPNNGDWDRRLTDHLYGGDSHYRFCQEVILGVGGVRMLRELGCGQLQRFHMNEGHAALLTIELARERVDAAVRTELTADDLAAVRRQCVFTTHTPVVAGHDQFPIDLVRKVLGDTYACRIQEHDEICREGRLNMTYLALSLCHYVNGVAKRHGDISRHMFAGYAIDSITNGVHAATWTAPPMAELFDSFMPGWRLDNASLRSALSIPDQPICDAHQSAKRQLIRYTNRIVNAGIDEDVLTIGFGRRAASYKRGDLIFEDLSRLKRLAGEVGRFQLIFAGKAHPKDDDGKRLIQRIIELGRKLAPDVPVAYLPNYDQNIGQLMTSGVDVWLNTPQPPLEASGTSGMKAALNGVPSLSILDGWWVEGCIDGVTGWSIGTDGHGVQPDSGRAADADALYARLEADIIPMFYHDRDRWLEVMRHSIALNGSYFNTHRMVQQYVLKAYFE